MSDEVTLQFDGMKELYETFNNLAKSLPPERVEPVLKQGAQVLQAAAKANAPRGETGNLIKGIVVKQLPALGNNPKSAIVKSTAQHDHLVEYGTKPRRQKNGRFTGSMQANPFFRPAIDTYKEPVIQAIVNDLSGKIDEAMK
jgi:HK97 gp10 family phage protein